MEHEARAVQESYEEENPHAGIISDYLNTKLPSGWSDMDIYARRQWLEVGGQGTIERNVVCTLELWTEALGNSTTRMDRYAAKELREIMDNMPGWVSAGRKQIRFSLYGAQRYYRRCSTNEDRADRR